MIDNCNNNVSADVLNNTLHRLINQVWKLIPMRENNEEWKKQLDTVIIEITGLSVIFAVQPIFLTLRAKLEGMREISSIEFDIYRKTVFECLTLLNEIKKTLI